jgi:hypothetical protein
MPTSKRSVPAEPVALRSAKVLSLLLILEALARAPGGLDAQKV